MYQQYLYYVLFAQKDALENLENGVQLLPRKDRYIFSHNVYFVKIKNEHGDVHFNYFFVSDFSDNIMRTYYK